MEYFRCKSNEIYELNSDNYQAQMKGVNRDINILQVLHVYAKEYSTV